MVQARDGRSADLAPTATGRRLFESLDDVVEFLRTFVRRFLSDLCLVRTAALSFASVVSLVPAVAVSLAFLSALPASGTLRSDVENLLTHHLLPDAGETAVEAFRTFITKAAALSALGFIGLTLTAILALVTVNSAFDTIWRVHRRRRIIVRVLAYGAVLVLGPLLIVGSLSLQGMILTTGKHLGGVAFTKGVRMAAPVFLILAEAAALMLLYRFVPTRRVHWRDAILGAVIGVVLLEAVKRGFTLYLQQFSTFQLIYGALAVLPVFLIWLYLCWVAVLFGAEIVAARPEWRSQEDAAPTSEPLVSRPP